MGPLLLSAQDQRIKVPTTPIRDWLDTKDTGLYPYYISIFSLYICCHSHSLSLLANRMQFYAPCKKKSLLNSATHYDPVRKNGVTTFFSNRLPSRNFLVTRTDRRLRRTSTEQTWHKPCKIQEVKRDLTLSVISVNNLMP